MNQTYKSPFAIPRRLFSKALPARMLLRIRKGGGGVGGLIGKYATVRRLEWRGHILLLHGIFNSNTRKAFYSALKETRAWGGGG